VIETCVFSVDLLSNGLDAISEIAANITPTSRRRTIMAWELGDVATGEKSIFRPLLFRSVPQAEV